MPSRLRSHLTYANVVSTLCLFILLGGSAYAASTISSKQIKNNSILGKDIKNGSVTGSDVKNRSLTKSDFKPGQLPAGAPGATGPQGATGPAGTSAASAFASVNDNAGLNSGKSVAGVTKNGTGGYRVRFAQNVTGCAILASPGFGKPFTGANSGFSGTSVVATAPAENDTVQVSTRASDGTPLDLAFFVALLC